MYDVRIDDKETWVVWRKHSLEAGGEGSASVAVQEVDGESFKGLSLGHSPPNGVLKLFVPTRDAAAALHLIGRQGRGQEIGQVVVPDRRQLKVLDHHRAREATDTRCYTTPAVSISTVSLWCV